MFYFLFFSDSKAELGHRLTVYIHIDLLLTRGSNKSEQWPTAHSNFRTI